MISNISQVISTPQSSKSDQTTSASAAVPAAQGAVSSGGGVSAGAVNLNAGTNGAQSAGSEKDLAAAVDHLNAKIQNLNRNLEFSINKDNGEVLVKIVDAQTHKVLRQIPSEEALAMAHDIDQYMQDHHIGLMKAKA